MYNSIQEMMALSAAGVRPPERLTVAQSCELIRRINNPGSYVGPWDNSIAPYLIEPMECLTSTDYTGMIFVGPARCGKSDLFFNWLGHTARYDPADMMVVNMTQGTARDWSQGDLTKCFRHSPEIGKLVSPGRQNVNTHSIRFLSGMRLLVKWPTITELSGKTSPRNWLFDYDRMPESIDNEGSPFDLTSKRAQTYGKFGMTVAEASPGWEIENPKWLPGSPHEAPPTRGILSLYNRGDRRRYYWKCFHCNHPFEPDFDLIVYPDTRDMVEAAEAARMACPTCGGEIYHDGHNGEPSKQEMNQTSSGNAKWVKDGMFWLPDGSVTGTPYRSDIASFWLKGTCAAFMTWREMVLKYLKANSEYERTGSQESLKVTVNVDQGKPYNPRHGDSERLPETLKQRARDLGERVIPADVRYATAQIDVQSNNFDVAVHGFDSNGDMFTIDRFKIRKSERRDDDNERFMVKPGSYLEDWDLLIEGVILKSYPLSDGSGRHMRIKMVACDSGGKEGVTANAYKFWRRLRDHPDYNGLHHRFMLIKGASSNSAPRVQIRYPDGELRDKSASARGEIPVLFINTNLIKDTFHQMLERSTSGGGSVQFPNWLPDEYFTELCVETRTPKGWVNAKSQRNESWDLGCYALALNLTRGIRYDQIKWENPPSWAEQWDDNDFVFMPDGSNIPIGNKKIDYDLSSLGALLA